eukprot:SAG11_NODE_853_length_6874_cov_1.980074_7_plen_75_part_00
MRVGSHGVIERANFYKKLSEETVLISRKIEYGFQNSAILKYEGIVLSDVNDSTPVRVLGTSLPQYRLVMLCISH